MILSVVILVQPQLVYLFKDGIYLRSKQSFQVLARQELGSYSHGNDKEDESPPMPILPPSLSSLQGIPIPRKSENIPQIPLELHTDLSSPMTLDDEIQQHAADVMREVSGKQQEEPGNSNRPFDPNLICPMCLKKFRIGEIHLFRQHVICCNDEPEVGDGYLVLQGGDSVQ